LRDVVRVVFLGFAVLMPLPSLISDISPLVSLFVAIAAPAELCVSSVTMSRDMLLTAPQCA
jgi:hypothetical protein